MAFSTIDMHTLSRIIGEGSGHVLNDKTVSDQDQRASDVSLFATFLSLFTLRVS